MPGIVLRKMNYCTFCSPRLGCKFEIRESVKDSVEIQNPVSQEKIRMEFPKVNHDRIDLIISQLVPEEIKPEEIDAFIGGMRKRLIGKVPEGERAFPSWPCQI